MRRALALSLARLALALAAAAQGLLSLADRVHPTSEPQTVRNLFGLEVLVDDPIPMSNCVALGHYLRRSYKHANAEA